MTEIAAFVKNPIGRSNCLTQTEKVVPNNRKPAPIHFVINMKICVVLVSMLAAADAFLAPSTNRASIIVSKTDIDVVPSRTVRYATSSDDLKNQDSIFLETEIPALPRDSKTFDAIPALTIAMIMFTSSAAYADSPDWGIFEGKTGSLLHPVTMIGMLALSISTALLGFEWRRQVRLCATKELSFNGSFCKRRRPPRRRGVMQRCKVSNSIRCICRCRNNSGLLVMRSLR